MLGLFSRQAKAQIMTHLFFPSDLYLLYKADAKPNDELLTKVKALGAYVHHIDVIKANFSPEQWRGISSLLKEPVQKLLDVHHNLYKQYLAHAALADQDVFEVLARYPELLVAPIAIYRNSACLCRQYEVTDIRPVVSTLSRNTISLLADA